MLADSRNVVGFLTRRRSLTSPKELGGQSAAASDSELHYYVSLPVQGVHSSKVKYDSQFDRSSMSGRM